MPNTNHRQPLPSFLPAIRRILLPMMAEAAPQTIQPPTIVVTSHKELTPAAAPSPEPRPPADSSQQRAHGDAQLDQNGTVRTYTPSQAGVIRAASSPARRGHGP